MKHYRFTFTKWLILLTALLALTFCLAACGKDEAPPLDSGTEAGATDGEGTTAAQEQPDAPSGDTPSGDNPSVNNPSNEIDLPLVSYGFVSNGDGTCSIGWIITNPQNNTDEIQLDIPETSPDGDTVTAINNLSLAGAGNVPRMILKEDYEKINAVLRQKVEAGEISEFNYRKYFEAVYTLNDPDQAASARALQQMLSAYPITAVSPIYVLSLDITTKDFTIISEYLTELVDYDMYDALADYNHMIEVAKASELCTTDMLYNLLSPYGNANINITALSIPDTVLHISSTAFSRGFGNVIEKENGICYIDKWALSADSKLTDIILRENTVGICEAAFQRQSLKSIFLPDNLQVICRSAFTGCDGLSEIKLPESLKQIGDFAFSECPGISEIVIPKNVEKIGSGVFSYDIGLTDIQVDTENTTYYAKNNCLIDRKAQTLVAGCQTSIIPNNNTINSIAAFAFADCKSLTSISIPNSVTAIGASAFAGCESLTGISIPNSVTAIGASAFADCHNLICEIIIPNGVEKIESYLFANCYRIPNIILSKDTTGIAYRAFSGCCNLTSITIPQKVTSIDKTAFESTGKLYEIINQSNVPLSIDETKSTRVIIDAYGNKQFKNNEPFELITTDTGFRFTHYNGQYRLVAYLGADEIITFPDHINGETYTVGKMSGYLRNITLSTGITAIEDNAFSTFRIENGIIKYSENTTLTSIIIPENVTSIGESAFEYCYNLESVIFTGNVQLRHIADDTFHGCSSLTNITIPEGVTSIGEGAFTGCEKLTSITIPNSVTNIGDMAFFHCSSLTSITIPDSVTSIGYWAFEGCSSLVYTEYNNGKYLGNANNKCLCLVDVMDATVTTFTIPETTRFIFGSAFEGCSGLTSITIPDSVTSIGDSTFYGCSSLTSITIPDSVTSIGNFAFFRCSSLTSITIPNSVTSIGDYAFDGCSSLTSISIPSSVTSIGGDAFSWCSSLTSITIPDSVTSIGNSAFKGCNNLTIYAETASMPSGWESRWNYSNRPVVWGYTSES